MVGYFVNNRAQTGHHETPQRIWIRVSVVFLLILVAGLATLAKNGQYFPKTTPAHCISMSTKMNVAHAPAIVAGDRVEQFAKLSQPQPLPLIRRTRLERLTTVLMPQIGVTVSRQHRSPPFSIA